MLGLVHRASFTHFIVIAQRVKFLRRTNVLDAETDLSYSPYIDVYEEIKKIWNQ